MTIVMPGLIRLYLFPDAARRRKLGPIGKAYSAGAPFPGDASGGSVGIAWTGGLDYAWLPYFMSIRVGGNGGGIGVVRWAPGLVDTAGTIIEFGHVVGFNAFDATNYWAHGYLDYRIPSRPLLPELRGGVLAMDVPTNLGAGVNYTFRFLAHLFSLDTLRPGGEPGDLLRDNQSYQKGPGG